MTSPAVVSRYADALADVALSPAAEARPDQVAAELRGFQQALDSSMELRNVLASPGVPLSRKQAVVARLASMLGIGRIARNFLFVLNHHRRMEALSAILDAFEIKLDERLGFSRAEVTSAGELGPERRAELERELGLVTGRRMRLRFAVDASLIGGVVARIGSTVYDGSVRSRLETLERRLKAE